MKETIIRRISNHSVLSRAEVRHTFQKAGQHQFRRIRAAVLSLGKRKSARPKRKTTRARRRHKK